MFWPSNTWNLHKAQRGSKKHGQANRWISFQNRIFHLYKSVLFTQQRPRRPETGIKGYFDEIFRLKNIPSGKTGLPFHMFRCSQKFSAGMTKKVAFHLLSNRIFWKLLVVFDIRSLTVNEFLSITSLEFGASLASVRIVIKPAGKGKLKKKDRKIFPFSCALFKFLEGLTIALDASDPASKYYLKNPTSYQQNQEQRH